MNTYQTPVYCPGNSWAATRINRILIAASYSVVIERRRDPAREEIARLRQLGLDRTADRIEKAEDLAEPPVPDGLHWDPSAVDVHGLSRSLRTLELHGDELRALLKRHAAGNVGLHSGAIAEASARAIESGEGLARSRFDLMRPSDKPGPHEPQTGFRRRRCPGEFIELLTLLDGGRPVFCVAVTSLDGVHGELN